jgi:hypothetical protein
MTRRRTKRGGLSTTDENKFLEERRKERKSELGKLGDLEKMDKPVVESVGTESARPRPVSVRQAHETLRALEANKGVAPSKAGRRKRRHTKRKSHRRR